MIEKLIKNPLTLKRYKRFKQLRRSVWASYLFIFIIFISATAEFWANSKPIMMSYQGEMYFPVVKTYHPTVFGQTDIFVTDYRKIDSDWEFWPLVKWDPFETNTSIANYPGEPTADNLLGTDDRGRDVLARLIYGFRYSIVYAGFVWFFSFSLGTIIGAIMGFWGGWTDMVGQRVVEIFESVPSLALLILLVAVFGSSLTLLTIFSVVLGWMMISIYIRAEFLKLRKREYVEAARAIGVPWWKIIFKHILPNALGPIVTFSPFAISGAIASLAILDFLGFGLPPPTPSWGELLTQAKKYYDTSWWLAVYPSLALFFSVATLNLIGEGVRDAFDPRKSL